MNRNRLFGYSVAALGALLLSWVLYDASSIVSTLGLSNVIGEASVALLGLFLVGVCFVGAFVLIRRAPVAANAL